MAAGLGHRLPRSFYQRSTLVVAREMLGKTLVHRTSAGVRAGVIVETEAYMGRDDRASHARHGPAGRSAVMWGEAGHAYVYLIYGMWHCFNAVTERPGEPGAVLVRAVAPIPDATERTSGPGLLCRYLGLDRSCTGLDLTRSDLYLTSAERDCPDAVIRMGPRIGVPYAGLWAEHPWRFWLADSDRVSRRVPGLPFDPDVLTRTGPA